MRIQNAGSSKTVNSPISSTGNPEEVKKLSKMVKGMESKISQIDVKSDFMKKQYKAMETRF